MDTTLQHFLPKLIQTRDRVFAQDITHLSRTIKLILCGVVGGMGALAFAPFFFWPALLCLSVFLWVLRSAKSGGEAFWLSFIFALCFYGANLYWVGNAFLTVGLGPVSLVAYIGLPLLLSFDIVTCATLAWKISQNQSRLVLALSFASAFTVISIIQSTGELAFPWVDMGYAMPLLPLQAASFMGAQGVGMCALFASLIPFVWYHPYTAVFGGIILLLCGWGMLSLQTVTTETPYNFRLIQPSIAQENKWNPEEIQKNLQLQGILSQLDAEKPIQAILWPEAAVPFDFSRYPDVQKNLSNAAPEGGYVFLGTIRKENGKLHNSFSILSDKNQIEGIYDKKHLVPFGEFVPFKHLLPGIQKLTHGAQDFSKGTRDSLVKLKNLPSFRVLICYEVLFAQEISPSDKERPEWLLNMTNDAWYGDTTGPHQHLAISQARAIEQGLPMVRVANNGISAIIDGKGRIVQRLGLNEVGIIDFSLPKSEAPTFFSRYNPWISVVFCVVNGLILLTLLWKNRQNFLKKL